MKLRFLMSHRRKNSVRDKVIGKKWICLERHPTDKRVGCHRGRVWPQNVVWLAFMGWVITSVNEQVIPTIWEGAEISRNWAATF